MHMSLACPRLARGLLATCMIWQVVPSTGTCKSINLDLARAAPYRYFTQYGPAHADEPRPYLSGYFRIKGLKLNWLSKFSPWFDVMLHVKFESPMRTAIGKYDGEWHVRVMST